MQVTEKAYDEIIDLFARGSSSSEILGFHPSPEAQARARYLLDRNRQSLLTDEEASELERLGELEQLMQLMQLVKARARLHADPLRGSGERRVARHTSSKR